MWPVRFPPGIAPRSIRSVSPPGIRYVRSRFSSRGAWSDDNGDPGCDRVVERGQKRRHDMAAARAFDHDSGRGLLHRRA